MSGDGGSAPASVVARVAVSGHSTERHKAPRLPAAPRRARGQTPGRDRGRKAISRRGRVDRRFAGARARPRLASRLRPESRRPRSCRARAGGTAAAGSRPRSRRRARRVTCGRRVLGRAGAVLPQGLSALDRRDEAQPGAPGRANRRRRRAARAGSEDAILMDRPRLDPPLRTAALRQLGRDDASAPGSTEATVTRPSSPRSHEAPGTLAAAASGP